MEKKKKLKDQIIKFIATVNSHHTGAYAAQAAYFFVLSLIPIFLLLLTMVQYTDVTMNDVMNAVLQVFPDSVAPLIRGIVYQVYIQSSGMIPITVIVALWSAGKGCTVCYIRFERDLFTYRDEKLFLSENTCICIYCFVPAGDYAFVSNLGLRKQYQQYGISAYTIPDQGSGFCYADTNTGNFCRIDCVLGSDIQIPSEQKTYGKNNFEKTASGSSVYGYRVAVDFIYIFYISGYIYRIFQYVWKYDNDYPDPALALRMYVYHSSWGRIECAAGAVF